MVGTRDRIIAATNELFRRTGYNATSLSQISKASGATIGSIYHFFPGGKDALTVEVIRSTGLVYRDLFTLMMDQAPDDPSSPSKSSRRPRGVTVSSRESPSSPRR